MPNCTRKRPLSWPNPHPPAQTVVAPWSCCGETGSQRVSVTWCWPGPSASHAGMSVSIIGLSWMSMSQTGRGTSTEREGLSPSSPGRSPSCRPAGGCGGSSVPCGRCRSESDTGREVGTGDASRRNRRAGDAAADAGRSCDTDMPGRSGTLSNTACGLDPPGRDHRRRPSR